jgi:hypothetical protein
VASDKEHIQEHCVLFAKKEAEAAEIIVSLMKMQQRFKVFARITRVTRDSARETEH